MNLKQSLAEESTVFLDSGFTGQPLLFRNPEQKITAHSPADIKPALKRIDRALNAGYFCPGYISYEAGRALMNMPLEETGSPLLWFGVYSRPEELPADFDHLRPAPPAIQPKAEIDYERYISGFRQVKDYIRAGDTYQVNYTFRLGFEPGISPEELFLRLRQHHPVPFSAFIQNQKYTIASHSPELFLRREGDRLLSRPMKGTAPRGRTVSEDNRRRRDLRESEKERAENLMIVDLLRNDLGKVGKIGTVEVPRLFAVEQYESVHQMVSTVETVPTGETPYEIFKALFPCGSITGAPKRRTMEIIREVEASPREIYTGSVGLFTPDGDFCFNIAIRTLFYEQGTSRARLGTGGGVVIDGEGEKEWAESWLKTEFLNSEKPDFSLVETIRFSPSEGLPRLAGHLERLEKSAGYFSIPLDRSAVRGRIIERLRDRQTPAKVRLLLERSGEVNLEVSELPGKPAQVRVSLASRDLEPREVPHLRHKTTFRPTYNKLRTRAGEQNFFDYLLLDESGYLTEGTITNIFVQIDDRFYTPPLERGLLPGVMRDRLLENGAEVRDIHRKELLEADNLYLTNALRGKMAVDYLELPKKDEVVSYP